jgi:hypothetical protein
MIAIAIAPTTTNGVHERIEDVIMIIVGIPNSSPPTTVDGWSSFSIDAGVVGRGGRFVRRQSRVISPLSH